MNAFEFIYFIGYSVAFCMLFVGTYDKECPEGTFFISILGGILSWGLPIFWIEKEIYERKFKKCVK